MPPKQIEISEKVLKFETFLNEKLKPDLKSVLEERDKIYGEIAEFLALKNSIETIKRAGLREGEPLKTKVDLGCNFYCQAQVPDPGFVFVEVGLGFFVEFTLGEAIAHIEKRTKGLEKKAEKLTDDSCKIKANIKLTLEGLKELQHIIATNQKKAYRDVLA